MAALRKQTEIKQEPKRKKTEKWQTIHLPLILLALPVLYLTLKAINVLVIADYFEKYLHNMFRVLGIIGLVLLIFIVLSTVILIMGNLKKKAGGIVCQGLLGCLIVTTWYTMKGLSLASALFILLGLRFMFGADTCNSGLFALACLWWWILPLLIFYSVLDKLAKKIKEQLIDYRITSPPQYDLISP